MKPRAPLALVMLVVVSIALVGCQNVAEKAVENATGVQVDQNGDQVTVETKEGDKVTVGGEQSLPEGWPQDVPVYEDATIKASATNEQDGKKQFVLTLESSDTGDAIASWYKEQLKAKGWKIISDMTNTADGRTSAVIGFGKAEEPEGTVTVIEESDKTTINQTFVQ